MHKRGKQPPSSYKQLSPVSDLFALHHLEHLSKLRALSYANHNPLRQKNNQQFDKPECVQYVLVVKTLHGTHLAMTATDKGSHERNVTEMNHPLAGTINLNVMLLVRGHGLSRKTRFVYFQVIGLFRQEGEKHTTPCFSLNIVTSPNSLRTFLSGLLPFFYY